MRRPLLLVLHALRSSVRKALQRAQDMLDVDRPRWAPARRPPASASASASLLLRF